MSSLLVKICICRSIYTYSQLSTRLNDRIDHIQHVSLSKWFCDTSIGAAQEQPIVVLLRGRPLAYWLLALGERGGHGDLCGSGRLSVIPNINGSTELYCAQACLA
jgi:hypothetical protein